VVQAIEGATDDHLRTSYSSIKYQNQESSWDRPVRKVDLIAICEPIVWKMWEPRRLTTLRASMACCRDFIHSSVALQPFVGSWPLLQFRNLFLHRRQDGLLG
jgi:hypothetical protein